jgi:OmpA-OmpF porin, OOP family
MLDTKTAKDTRGTKPSKLKSTKTEALMKFLVVHKEKGPIKGIVVSMAAPDGTKYYTEETDETGYAEVLVPVGKKYEIVYVSLGRKDITATYDVTNEPNQNIKLTLRYTRYEPPADGGAERVVLDGVEFDTNKATIRPESLPRLDRVVEYMQRKKSVRIEISGHTDNVGKKAANKVLSQKRAAACRDYVISKGIDGSRIEAVGYGDERPVAPNDNEGGRQKNRRIEATEL